MTESTLIADIETDGLNPKVIHCLAIGSLIDGDEILYADQTGYPSIREGITRLCAAERVVFHNGLGFDYPVLRQFFPEDDALIKLRERIWDTLIMSRMCDPKGRSHGLADWGERLGFPKGSHEDWSQFSEAMGEYCKLDVAVTRKVYQELLGKFSEDWEEAFRLEQDFAWVIALQQRHGFRLDVEAAEELASTLRQEMGDIEVELQEVFPPKVIERYSEKTGKRLKDKVEVFNPGSRKQIAERLIERYQWKPKKYTPTGAPQIDEQILLGMKFPEAQLLSRYMRCQKQMSQISEGDSAWLKCVDENGYVHGSVNTIGTATYRCSHFAPNIAQVDKKDLRMRDVWKPDPGHVLVGCDADQLELVMLAHYLGMFDNGEYRDALLNGSKADGTDVHSRTAKLVGVSRDDSKRVTYAYLYGASDRKLTQILKESNGKVRDGKEARRRLNEGINGLGKLAALIHKRAKRGYIKGLDGRRVPIISEHSALNFTLQSAGAILMKKALQVFHYDMCASEGYVVNDMPVHFNYCANVHDEVQMSCEPDHAEKLGGMFADAITKAGEELCLRCPTSGSYDIGSSWKETH
jgi:DNA polymerase-1